MPVLDLASGKTVALKECPDMKPLYAGREGLRPYDTILYLSPFYRDYLPQLVAFMKRNGVQEDSYFEQFDEHGPLTYIPPHRVLRELAPGLKLMNYGAQPLATERKARGVGYADRWAPGLGALDKPEVLQTLQRRRAEHGETYGFYVCGVMERPDGKDTPLHQAQPADHRPPASCPGTPGNTRPTIS